MPNWVKNIVRTSEKTMQKIKEKYFENGILDFNKVIPMPETLNLTEGSITDTAIFYAMSKKDMNKQKEIFKILKSKKEYTYGNYLKKLQRYCEMGSFKHIEKQADEFEPDTNAQKLQITSLEQLGDTFIQNIQKYGSPTWYDWCIENWGTKWGVTRFACNNTTMIFETAWSIPENIFDKLASEFPHDTIEVSYADEDYSSHNNGILTYYNGSCEYDTCLHEDFIEDVWCEKIDNNENSKDIEEYTLE